MKHLLLMLFSILMLFTGFRCTKNISEASDEQIDLKIKEVVGKANTSCGSVHPSITPMVKRYSHES